MKVTVSSRKMIQTKFIGPSNTKGARIKAYTADQSVTISYPHELSGYQAHIKAVETLINKFNWNPDNNLELVITDSIDGKGIAAMMLEGND